MLTLPNLLSLSRAPLAFLLLIENTTVRLTAIVLAMLTDSIDGFLARRTKSESRFGAILDPTMDKFFVFFALSIFLYGQMIEPWQACAMISRDFALGLFGVYLSAAGRWDGYTFGSIVCGKIATGLQFFIMIGLTLGIVFPWQTYIAFIFIGTLAFGELFFRKRRQIV